MASQSIADRPGREHFADQIGSAAERELLGGSGGREVDFDLFEHPPQRDGQGQEGSRLFTRADLDPAGSSTFRRFSGGGRDLPVVL